MNVRKLCARLGPGGVNLNGASGGKPEYTASDISHALGKVRRSFGRELFCALWWPDGATIGTQELLDSMMHCQFEEWRRRADRLEAAHLALHLARDEHMGGFEDAIREVQRAKAQMWPAIGRSTRYCRIRIAVFHEMRSPNLCSACGGRGQLRHGPLMVYCPQCLGMGRRGTGERDRARWLGCAQTTFRDRWRQPYEFLYDVCRRAENKAAVALEEKLLAT